MYADQMFGLRRTARRLAHLQAPNAVNYSAVNTSRVARLACWYAALAAATLCLAQQGHPLTGTWSGDWGPTATKRTQITMVLNWDGKNVTGLINPGPDAIPITGVYVDYANWTIRIEATSAHIVAEGKIDDLGSYHRTVTGTWQQGSMKGDFKLTRD